MGSFTRTTTPLSRTPKVGSNSATILPLSPGRITFLLKEGFEYSGYEIKGGSGSHPRYWSFAEEWEHKTEELQNLPLRMCYAKHKIEGGMIQLYTVKIDPAWEMLGIREDEYSDYLEKVPFGHKYLHNRLELAESSTERRRAIEDESKTREVVPELPVEKPVKREPVVVRNIESVDSSEEDPRIEREHRRLQHLIKRMSEQCGYLATIEKPTADGKGRV